MDWTVLAVCFLSVLAAEQAAGQAAGIEDTVDLQSTPAYLIIAKEGGEIWRCDFYNPKRCELFYTAPSWVYFTLVHGQHLYAALTEGQVLRCEWYSKSSCTILPLSTDAAKAYWLHTIRSLAVTGGYLYAGSDVGILLRCELNLLRNCVTMREFTQAVIGIFVFAYNIYVATYHSSLFKCSNGEGGFNCSLVQGSNEMAISGVSHLGNTFITVDSDNDVVFYYNMTSSGSMLYKNNVSLPSILFTYKVEVFRRKIYVLTYGGDIKVSTENDTSFTDYVQHIGAMTLSFVYGVRHMQTKEAGSCLDGRLPLAAFTAEQRWRVEVDVVEGRLVDARGAAVDTRGAGAVFAMGPDGQILLIGELRSGLAHIPSLFAGGPVAGAGDIHVQHGVIKRIVACSVHYRPDVRLNRQVVDELYRKGYTRADDIILEECDYKCDKDDHSEL